MLSDLLNLFFPTLCHCCESLLEKNEKIICTTCQHQLPLTDNHLEEESTTKKVFYGRIKIENATSLLLFEKKGIVQKLIHNLKYKGHEEIGEFLGKWLGENLKPLPEYQEITTVVPVPLHKKKLKSRGFNQVEKFGREIAKSLNAEYVDDVLLKISASNSQAFKKRLSRWGKMEETFLVQNKAKLEGEHILLVDDLVTTGATLEACYNKLKEIPHVKISIATMAIAG